MSNSSSSQHVPQLSSISKIVANLLGSYSFQGGMVKPRGDLFSSMAIIVGAVAVLAVDKVLASVATTVKSSSDVLRSSADQDLAGLGSITNLEWLDLQKDANSDHQSSSIDSVVVEGRAGFSGAELFNDLMNDLGALQADLALEKGIVFTSQGISITPLDLADLGVDDSTGALALQRIDTPEFYADLGGVDMQVVNLSEPEIMQALQAGSQGSDLYALTADALPVSDSGLDALFQLVAETATSGGLSTGALAAGAIAVVAVAAGGGGGSGSSGTPTQLTIIDPYVKGATVFLDTNGNNQLDAGEVQGTTDASGNVSLVVGASTGTFVSVGGTHTINGVEQDVGVLMAPVGYAVVTPLTLLLAVTPGLTEAQLLSNLGLPAGVSLNADPIAALSAGGANAAAYGNMLTAGAAVAAATKAAFEGLGGSSNFASLLSNPAALTQALTTITASAQGIYTLVQSGQVTAATLGSNAALLVDYAVAGAQNPGVTINAQLLSQAQTFIASSPALAAAKATAISNVAAVNQEIASIAAIAGVSAGVSLDGGGGAVAVAVGDSVTTKLALGDDVIAGIFAESVSEDFTEYLRDLGSLTPAFSQNLNVTRGAESLYAAADGSIYSNVADGGTRDLLFQFETVSKPGGGMFQEVGNFLNALADGEGSVTSYFWGEDPSARTGLIVDNVNASGVSVATSAQGRTLFHDKADGGELNDYTNYLGADRAFQIVYSESRALGVQWQASLAKMIDNGLVFAPSNLVIASSRSLPNDWDLNGTAYLNDFAPVGGENGDLSRAGIDIGFVRFTDSDHTDNYNAWKELDLGCGLWGLYVNADGSEYTAAQHASFDTDGGFDLFAFGNRYLTDREVLGELSGSFDEHDEPHLGIDFRNTVVVDQLNDVSEYLDAGADLFWGINNDLTAVTHKLEGWHYVDSFDAWFSPGLFGTLTSGGA
jgi:hypothetical protein